MQDSEVSQGNIPKFVCDESISLPRKTDICLKSERVCTVSESDHFNIISPPAAGRELNYKKANFLSLSDGIGFDNTEPDQCSHDSTKLIQKNDPSSTVGNEMRSNHVAENVISAILSEVIQKIVVSAAMSDFTSGKLEAANQLLRLVSNCTENDPTREQLIKTADDLTTSLKDRCITETNMKDYGNVVMTEDCRDTKTAPQHWLQSRENEVNVILSEVEDSHTNNRSQKENSVESLTDIDGHQIQKKLHSQSEKNTELFDKLSKSSKSFRAEVYTFSPPEMVKKKERTIDEKKSISVKNTFKKAFKSPLLRRKEIRDCISLHNDCESSDLLEELLTPALCIRNPQNFIDDDEIRGTWTTSYNNPIENVDSDSSFIDRDSVRTNCNHRSTFILPIFHFQSLSSKVRRGGMSWFPWKTLSFLLLVSTTAIISADIEKAGGKFSSSSMGQFLSDVGQYDRVAHISQAIKI